MATLAQLQARIILDTARDDLSPGGELAQALADAIMDAIASYADEPFWFNTASGDVTTAVNVATIDLPDFYKRAEWFMQNHPEYESLFHTRDIGGQTAMAS